MRQLRLPLRLADKLLLVAGVWMLGVAVALFWTVPQVGEQVVTETQTTTRLTAETRSVTWAITETRTSTIRATTMSPTTWTMTTHTTIAQVVTSAYARLLVGEVIISSGSSVEGCRGCYV